MAFNKELILRVVEDCKARSARCFTCFTSAQLGTLLALLGIVEDCNARAAAGTQFYLLYQYKSTNTDAEDAASARSSRSCRRMRVRMLTYADVC